jgi:hypothetical protein
LFEFSFVCAVRLIVFGNYSDFLLQIGGRSQALGAVGLGADAVKDRVAFGAVELISHLLVDHDSRLDYYKSKGILEWLD